MMEMRLLIALFCLIGPITAQAGDWWRNTSLAPAYLALDDGQPNIAWAELLTALNQPSPPPESAWAALQRTLLDQSHCGRELDSSARQPEARPRLVVMRKTNQGRERFQLKVAIEGNARPSHLTLSDTRGRLWLSGPPTAKVGDYSEWEGEERFQPIPAGLYRLNWSSGQAIPVIIPPSPPADWIRLDPLNSRQPIRFTLPEPGLHCPAGLPTLSWFDAGFERLGPARILEASSTLADWLEPRPEDTRWASFVVTQRHLQPGVTVDTQQRLTLPTP